MKEAEIRPQELFNKLLELSRKDIERFFADKRGFVEVPCPACASDDPRPGLDKHGFHYVTCAVCGTLYLSPRPTGAQLDVFYREGEAVKFWCTDFYKHTADARREKMFRPRAQLTGELAKRYGLTGAATLADVGAGYGIFLEEVRRLEQFKSIIGIEPNTALSDVCRGRGFEVVSKNLEDVAEGEVAADLATAFEVLEHVFDPAAFLVAFRRLLKPGGIALFTTLTVSGFDIQVLWERSKSVHPPHHINLISVEGMRILVDRVGLRLLDLTTPGTLDVDIVANIVAEDPTIPLPRFVSYLLSHRDGEAREAFQRYLSAHCLSSHIRVVAQR